MNSPYVDSELAILCDYFNVARPKRLESYDSFVNVNGMFPNEGHVSEIELANAVGKIALNEQSLSYSGHGGCAQKRRNNEQEVLIPRLLFSIGWNDSFGESSWTETYYMTFFPVFNRYVVTACQSPNDVLDMEEVAIGWRYIGEPRLKIAEAIVTESWKELHAKITNGAWKCVNKTGLVTEDDACMWRNKVWRLFLN